MKWFNRTEQKKIHQQNWTRNDANTKIRREDSEEDGTNEQNNHTSRSKTTIIKWKIKQWKKTIKPLSLYQRCLLSIVYIERHWQWFLYWNHHKRTNSGGQLSALSHDTDGRALSRMSPIRRSRAATLLFLFAFGVEP